MINITKGLRAEESVREYFLRKSFVLIRNRWKTPYAELDLVFLNPLKTRFCIVEVKTNGSSETLDYRLSAGQRLRIQRASLWLRFTYHKDVDVYLALVKPDSQIVLVNFEDFHL